MNALGAALLLATCELVAPEPHVTSETEAAVDEEAPGRARITGVTVSRGRASAFGCGPVTSCDDIGVITLELQQPDDDRTPTGELGYRLGLSAGALPEGLTLPDRIKAPEGVIDLVWVDGATDAQDGFAFELSVAAIDLAGNFGPFSPSILVEHPGALLGCGQGAAPGAFAALGLCTLVLRRRRRAAVRSAARAAQSSRAVMRSSLR